MGQSVLPLTVSIDEAVAEVLASAPCVPKRLYSSDLPRCSDLAHGLADAWGIELKLTAELREMNFGSWEGRHYDDLEREDGARWRAWCDDWKHVAPPGGECLRTFTSRVEGWLKREQPDAHTLLVTHAGVIRALEVMAGKTWDEAMATQHEYLGWRAHHVPEL